MDSRTSRKGNGRSEHSAPTLAQHELRKVAVAAQCDPRSVVAYLNGARIWSTTRARVESALTACGYSRLVRTD